MKIISISTNKKNEFIDITDEIKRIVPKNFSGIIVCYVPHTTCAITINEGYDPNVVWDMLNFFKELVPNKSYFKHFEWNSPAHIKSSIFWVSETIVVENWDLLLGQWQKVFFCEFDGPRNRKLLVKFIWDNAKANYSI
jgi:secondary thiamine-phosphate synthase enzyme